MTTRTVVGPMTHEAGNMGEWDGSTNVTASTTGAITGTYSARGGAGAAADGVAYKLYGEVLSGRCCLTILKCNYRPRATPAGGDPRILSHDLGGSTRYVLQRDDADGKLYINSTANKWSTAPTNGTVYALELWCFDSGTGGRGYALLYVDGVLRITAIVNDAATNDAIQLEVLRVAAAGKCTWDEVVDDVEVLYVDSWN